MNSPKQLKMENQKFHNLTNVKLRVKRVDGEDLVLDPNENGLLGCENNTREIFGTIDNVPIFSQGEFTLRIPDNIQYEDGDALIVSIIVGDIISKKTEAEFNEIFKGKKVRIFSPASGGANECERDEQGRIIRNLGLIEYLPIKTD